MSALVPWLRPAALASDSATSIDVAIHALDWYEGEKGKVDGLLLLQPTSPFRNSKNIMDSLALWNKNIDMVVSVKETKSNPYLSKRQQYYHTILPENFKNDI